MRKTPTHIIEAAARLASEAPTFTPDRLAAAYRAIGVTADSQESAEDTFGAAA
jgi:hypothetical protein